MVNDELMTLNIMRGLTLCCVTCVCLVNIALYIRTHEITNYYIFRCKYVAIVANAK